MKLHPYLFFNGNCRQAMEFYKKCLGGELQLFRAGDAPPGHGAMGSDDAIMNATLTKGDFLLMASDGMPTSPNKLGDACYLSLILDSVQESERIFSELSSGGRVTMPLAETFWATRFGMCVDAYGVHWMINCGMKG